jgi:hypothetical protein
MTEICTVLLFNMEKTFDVLEGSTTTTVLQAELTRCGGKYRKQTHRSWDLSSWSSKVVCGV